MKPEASAPPLDSYGSNVPIAQPINEAIQNSNENDFSTVRQCLYLPFDTKVYREMLYHLINSLFGGAVSPLLFVVALLGLVTIPLCGFGMIMLEVNALLIRVFAVVDVALYNYIAPKEDRVDIPNEYLLNSPSPATVNLRISKSLRKPFSKQTWLAILYFSIIKYPLGLISSAMITSIWFGGIAAILSFDISQIFAGFLLLWIAKSISRYFTEFSMYLTRTCLCEHLPTIVAICVAEDDESMNLDKACYEEIPTKERCCDV